MSAQQLNDVIHRITATFGSWGPDTTIEQMRQGWDDLFADVKPEVGAKREPVSAGGVKAEWVTAPGAASDRAILYLHGGGFVLGSIKSHGDLAERLSRAAKARVLIIDYRLAPEHPFPAPVEDAVKAYRWLLDQGFKPGHLAIAGDSAGGGLTFSTLLAIKKEKLPMPACATPLSPWVDLENVGETMQTKAADDPMVQKHLVDQMATTYVQQGNLRDPLVSPLHGILPGCRRCSFKWAGARRCSTTQCASVRKRKRRVCRWRWTCGRRRFTSGRSSRVAWRRASRPSRSSAFMRKHMN